MSERPTSEPAPKEASGSSFEVALEEPEAWRRRLTITVAPARVARARAKERDRLSGTLRLKGFRAGKVPARVVEQRYGELLDQRTVQRLLESTYEEAMREHALEPIGAPKIGQVQYTPGENLTFQVDVEIMPTLNLERMGGFRVHRPEVSVTDQDVADVLERLREERAVWEPRSEPPEDRDLVAVRIERLHDESGEIVATDGEPGAPVTASEPDVGAVEPPTSDESGAEGELYRFELGAGYAIPDVEAAIGTLSPGEEGTFTVTFPDDFGDAELAATTQNLRIELAEVKRRKLAPLDDDFAAGVGDFESLEDLHEKVREDLVRGREEEAESSVRDQLLDALIEANAVEAPSTMIESYLDRLLETPDGEEVDPERAETARRSLRPIAEQQLRRQLVVDHLIDELDLEPTADAVEARVGEIAEQRNMEPAEVRRRLVREGGMEAIRRRLAVDLVFDHLEGLSTVE